MADVQWHRRCDFGDGRGWIHPALSAVALLLHVLDFAADRRTINLRGRSLAEATE